MSERFTADELMAAIEWMYGFTAPCHPRYFANDVTNGQVNDWCVSHHGRMAIFTYPKLPNEHSLRFGLNGRWARMGLTFYFEKFEHAFAFKMRWG